MPGSSDLTTTGYALKIGESKIPKEYQKMEPEIFLENRRHKRKKKKTEGRSCKVIWDKMEDHAPWYQMATKY